MRLRTDSASSRSWSAVEPIRSAKTTVTILRASAFSGAGGRRPAPQASQNLAAGRTSPTQPGHLRTSGAAHSSQNLAPARLSWLQAEQIMACGRAAARDPSRQERQAQWYSRSQLPTAILAQTGRTAL